MVEREGAVRCKTYHILLIGLTCTLFLSSCDTISSSKIETLFQDDFKNLWPELSPDGNYLTFYSEKIGYDHPHLDYCIYCVDLGTSEIHQLTYKDVNSYTWDVDPCWSPDGRWIYFVRDSYGPGLICRMPYNGTEDDNEVLFSGAEVFALNSDGSKIVLALSYTEFYLAVLDLDTFELTPVTEEDLTWYRSLCFGPDDESVIAVINNDPVFEVKVYPLNGDDPYNFDYDFSDVPDKISLREDQATYLFSVHNQLLEIPVEGGESYDLTPNMYGSLTDGSYDSEGDVCFSHLVIQDSTFVSTIYKWSR
ncbi:MAG: hypothetical protein GF403_07650 [Candidatus Coatesbacteria bacterium]|nr:hypothetical protein [Candidatus Coatesbacteria bacterium]